MDFKPLSELKDRREFHEAFQSAMGGAHQNLRALWHFERDQNLPKTYLIEFHPRADGHGNHDWSPGSVFSALERVKTDYALSVKRTQDESLLFLSHSEGSERSSEFIIDCLNPRFLAFHTLSNATAADRFVLGLLTRYEPRFDMFWLPVQLLEGVAKREIITGWEVQYEPLVDVDESGFDRDAETDGSEDGPAEELELEPPARSLRRPRVNMELEHPEAFETYRRLAADSLLPDMPLNAIDAQRVHERLESYARARIKSDGKMTGRGPNFLEYLQIVDGTLDSYASTILALESKYWLQLDGACCDDVMEIALKGEPFCIRFSRNIDVGALVRHMFDCKRPFRLMGEPRNLQDDYVVCDAIDLHVNQPVGFEIAPDFMRIYLYAGTCGNTLVRIIRSLQHFVDSKLTHPLLEAP